MTDLTRRYRSTLDADHDGVINAAELDESRQSGNLHGSMINSMYRREVAEVAREQQRQEGAGAVRRRARQEKLK